MDQYYSPAARETLIVPGPGFRFRGRDWPVPSIEEQIAWLQAHPDAVHLLPLSADAQAWLDMHRET
jgi:hypothetical protein